MNRIILVLFLTPIITFAQADKIKKYSHPNYSIEYPENWILDESGKEGSTFVIYPKIESDKVFVENINLVKQNLGQNELTIEKLKSTIENEVSNMLDNSKIITSEIVNKKGVIHHEILAEGETSGMNFIIKIYTFPVNNALYTLTLVSNADDYENIKIVSSKIMDSFSIK